jgi:hypothetical protein
MEETRRQRFKRIAGARTNKILDMLKLLGNCSNTGNYEYSDNDVKKIFNAIESEVKASKAKFIKSTKKNKFEL